MAQGKKEEAEAKKAEVAAGAKMLLELEEKEKEINEKITKIMMVIPNIIDESVPIGKDDSENVEITKYGEPVVPEYEIPYHTEIMEKLNGIDFGQRTKGCRKRILLFNGRHCKTSFRCYFLCKRLHD